MNLIRVHKLDSQGSTRLKKKDTYFGKKGRLMVSFNAST